MTEEPTEIDVTSTAEVAEDSTAGQITIDITSDNVKYDSNLSLPEVLFWMEIVRSMIVQSVTKTSDA